MISSEYGNTPSNLRIFQLNLRKSFDAHGELINIVSPEEWDVIALQEPALNSVENVRASRHWQVFYPSTKSTDGHQKLRAVTLVNAKINICSQIELNSSDIVGVNIGTKAGVLSIYNIYNDGTNNDTLDHLTAHFEGRSARNLQRPLLWLGDFNRHHHTWEGDANGHLRSPADRINPLLDLIVEHGMQQLLPAGIPTRIENGSQTRPDNVWATDEIMRRTVECNTWPEWRPNTTDHLPIVTIIDMEVERLEEEPRPNYRKTDWEKFREGMEEAMAGDESLKREPQGVEEMEAMVDALTSHMQQQPRTTTPISKFNAFQKPWWADQCKEAHRRKCRTYAESKKWKGTPDHPSHRAYKTAQQEMKNTVKESKEKFWRNWIENASDKDLWDINRFQKRGNNDGSKERIPPLKTKDGKLTQTEEEKAAVLADMFFPPPPALAPAEPTRNPRRLPDWTPFTAERVRRAANHLKRGKAPGPDSIPNEAIQEALPSIIHALTTIYNAALRLRRIPKQWKESTTIVLRKPGKPSYNIAKAYRPIALLNTLGKLLSALMAEDLTFLCERYNLLPNTQFGGRPGRTTTDALHLLTGEIKKAWRSSKVVSALFLDIQAAFPNVVRPILIENMRQKGIPEVYVQSLEDMLTNRTTRLKFDGTHSEPRPITNGNSQGCPLSMILYLFYIAPLLEIANGKEQLTVGFVDDSTLLAIGRTFQETHATLKDMMERAGGVFDWSRTHNSPLETSKLALIDFTRSATKRAESATLTLNVQVSRGQTETVNINPCQSYKLLGVVIDQQLRWNKHQELVHSRAVKWTALFSRIHKVLHGLPIRMGRQLYKAVAIPRIQYAADLWYTPIYTNLNETRRRGSVAITNKLQAVQRRAAIGIAGALRTTAGDVLDAHINLLPIGLALELTCRKAAARLASLPITHPLAKAIKRASARLLRRHNSPMHYLFHTANIDAATMETIRPAPRSPNFTYPLERTIDKSREKAIERDGSIRSQNVAIYTDGSGMEGKIGAAAVLYRNGRKTKSVRYLLGADTEHTVHEGELVGIALGIQLARSIQTRIQEINISLDNQAAIQSMTHLRARAGQHVVASILSDIKRLKREQKRREMADMSEDDDESSEQTAIQIQLTWVPGHEGVAGNEAADEEAKKAITERASEPNQFPGWLRRPLPTNISAVKQELKRQAKEEARAIWSKSTRFARSSRIDESMPSGKYLALTDKLSRSETAILIQLRTGHIGLNGHLKRINRADSPWCPHCGERNYENLSHLLYICPKYGEARVEWERHLWEKTEVLREVLGTEEGIKRTMEFLRKTGRIQMR